jgi:hypothetical protein
VSLEIRVLNGRKMEMKKTYKSGDGKLWAGGGRLLGDGVWPLF